MENNELSYDPTEKNLKKFLKLGVICKGKAQEFLDKWFKELEKDKKESQEALRILMEYPIDEPINIVRVIWEDANTMPGTSSYTNIKERGLLTANTIGYLVYEDEKSIAICGFVFPDSHGEMLNEYGMTVFKDVHIIPKNCVKQIIVLKNDYDESRKFKEENEWTLKNVEKNK